MFQNLHRVNCDDIMAKNNNVVLGLHTLLGLL